MIPTTSISAKSKIKDIQVTTDLLADRGGLVPLMRYADSTLVLEEVASILSPFRKGKKGVSVSALARQIAAFFFDGTSRHLSRFDDLKRDKGYHAILEEKGYQIASSHQVKRILHKMPATTWSQFRSLLRRMFATRLRESKPEVVELFLDTMVLDNDDAQVRQGNQPTYKKVKGFQPLNLIWDGQIIDTQFRGGSMNGNHGRTAFTMIAKAHKIIRKELGYEVAVVVRMDGGFFDGKLFESLDVSNIGFICSGRLTPEIKLFADQQEEWAQLDTKRQCYNYFEFGTRCKEWKRFYRAVFLRQQFDADQKLLEFARPDNVIITNMGVNRGLFNAIPAEVSERLFAIENLIKGHHGKGAEELTHRGLKNFGFQQLPFKKFGANMAFYYMMVVSFNLMEWYKRDILVHFNLVGKGSYATTIRRVAIDFAAKFIRTGGKVIMKVTTAAMERLDLRNLWLRCLGAPVLI